MLRCITLFVFLCLALGLAGQSVCSGNLGENIFTQGDFGRGIPVILPTDPGIAPGFQYATQVPFDDGRYTITNDMVKWPDNYDTWLSIGDNSNDLLGYMMVVNASHAPGIFYQQTVDGLCDNTLYEFSADVINIVQQHVQNHIFPNVSFLIDGEVRFTTGPIPQDETWRTFGFTFITQPGQEQVTLTLRNNAPGGIGNDLALDNISFRPCGPESNIEIDMEGRVCENTLYPTLSAIVESDTGYFQWQVSTDMGLTWSDIPGATDRTYQSDQLSAQTYLFRYLFGLTPQHVQNPKCRIVSANRRLEVVPVNFTIVDTLCEGLSFDLGGNLFSETGTYMQLLTAQNGCDSLVTLELVIVPDPGIDAEIATTDPSCAGEADGAISVTNFSGGAPPFNTVLAGSTITPQAGVFPVAAGPYTVVVSDRHQCSAQWVVQITDPEPFTIEVTGASSVILGHAATLDVTGNYEIGSITWSPASWLECPTCISTSARPLTSSVYVATAASEAGCVASDSVFIAVDRDPSLYIPNVFSPNGDQINDSWGVIADPLNIPLIKRVAIYDRWGNTLFSRSDIPASEAAEIWNGNDIEEPLGAGVYVYLLELLLADERIVPVSGTVTLIK